MLCGFGVGDYLPHSFALPISALLSNATLAAWATTKGALLVQSREETWATVVVVVLIVAVVVLWLLCDVLDKHTPHYTRFPAKITE